MAVRESSSDRLPADERRASIITAAWGILSEYGLEGLTIESVVARVGVSRPIFYRHFSDRTDVLAALFDDYITDLADRIAAAIADAPSLEEVITRSLRTYFECFDRRGAVVRSLIDHVTRSPKFEQSRQAVRDQNMRLVLETFVRLGLDVPSASVLIQLRLLQAAAMETAVLRAESPQTRDEIEAVFMRFKRAAIASIMDEIAAESRAR